MMTEGKDEKKNPQTYYVSLKKSSLHDFHGLRHFRKCQQTRHNSLTCSFQKILSYKDVNATRGGRSYLLYSWSQWTIPPFEGSMWQKIGGIDKWVSKDVDIWDQLVAQQFAQGMIWYRVTPSLPKYVPIAVCTGLIICLSWLLQGCTIQLKQLMLHT